MRDSKKTFGDWLKASNQNLSFKINREVLLFLNPIFIGIFAFTFSEVQRLKDLELETYSSLLAVSNDQIYILNRKQDSLNYYGAFLRFKISLDKRIKRRYEQREQYFPNKTIVVDKKYVEPLKIQISEIVFDQARLLSFSKISSGFDFPHYLMIADNLNIEYDLVNKLEQAGIKQNQISLDSLNLILEKFLRSHIAEEMSINLKDSIKKENKVNFSSYDRQVDNNNTARSVKKLQLEDIASNLTLYKFIRFFSGLCICIISFLIIFPNGRKNEI